MSNTILFYAKTLTNRLTYTTDLVFEQLLGLNVVLTQNQDQFLESQLPKIHYATQRIVPSSLFQKATNLLFETAIVATNIETLADFFSFKEPESCSVFSKFDPLARIFYLVSRYEEYLAPPSLFDAHNRFTAAASLSKKNNFLREPIVNQYVIAFKKLLSEHYPELKMTEAAYQFQPTFDIDQAWQVRHKGRLRTIGGGLSELLKGDFQKLKNRVAILRGDKKDPFFTFSYIFELHQNCPPVVFWLLGDYARFDKNISPQNIDFQELIQNIAKKYAIGLHPSYRSNEAIEILEKEKKRLESILKKADRKKLLISNTPLESIVNNRNTLSETNFCITKSRQHFLKLRFPDTYRRCLQVGIKEDWSMGYADDIGFRAGIATPFFWFDLEKNQTTELKIYPFQVMDVTLRLYLKLSTEAAVEETRKIIDATRAVGGTFVTLWHNDNLSETEGWAGWRGVYEAILEAAI